MQVRLSAGPDDRLREAAARE
eukprot:COSAG02_NODE_38459_length_428_cov_3.224924_1_plen_20_part_10